MRVTFKGIIISRTDADPVRFQGDSFSWITDPSLTIDQFQGYTKQNHSFLKGIFGIIIYGFN